MKAESKFVSDAGVEVNLVLETSMYDVWNIPKTRNL